MGGTIRRTVSLAMALLALCAPAAALAAEDPATAQPGGAAAPAPGPAASEPNPPGQAPQPPGAANPAPSAADGAIENAASRDAEAGSDLPAPLVALGALALLLAVAALIWGLFRFFAWEPRWLLGARHAVAEAGWRTSGAWGDFTDWVRRGRTAG